MKPEVGSYVFSRALDIRYQKFYIEYRVVQIVDGGILCVEFEARNGIVYYIEDSDYYLNEPSE